MSSCIWFGYTKETYLVGYQVLRTPPAGPQTTVLVLHVHLNAPLQRSRNNIQNFAQCQHSSSSAQSLRVPAHYLLLALAEPCEDLVIHPSFLITALAHTLSLGENLSTTRSAFFLAVNASNAPPLSYATLHISPPRISFTSPSQPLYSIYLHASEPLKMER